MQKTLVWFLGQEDPLEKGKAAHSSVLDGFPGGSDGKESTCNVGHLGSIPGGGHGNILQYSCLEKPMDRGACLAIVHRVIKSWTQLKQLSIQICTTITTINFRTFLSSPKEISHTLAFTLYFSSILSTPGNQQSAFRLYRFTSLEHVT